MKVSQVLPLILLLVLSLGLFNFQLVSLEKYDIQPVEAQSSQTIYILGNGTVHPSEAPIQRAGEVYTFTSDITGAALIVRRNHIVVDGAGYTLQGQGEVGVDLTDRRNVTIRNILIKGCNFGIYLWNSFEDTITENHITDNMEGIRIQNSSNNIVSSNNLTRNYLGVSIYSSSYNTLRDNTLNNNFNFELYGTELSHFINYVDTSNTVNGKKFYYLIDEREIDINPSTYTDLGNLVLVNCTGINVQNLELTENSQGMVLAYTTGSTITQNSLTNNRLGIGLFYSSNNMLSDNKIADNYRGTQLSKSTNNGIQMNNITNNENGIYLFESSTNTFSGNNVTYNQLGIGFRASSSNYIYGNYFINNTEQVHDSHTEDPSITLSLNFWDFDYPRGGNYWSDYTGIDIKSGPDQDQPGSDGIGDTPYILYANNKDNYPLMPYGNPLAVSIISPENKTYTTNEIPLNFTVNENTSWIGYSLDNKENVTLTGNTTLTGLSQGTHKLSVYAEDVEGNPGVPMTIYFTVAQESGTFPLWILAVAGIITVSVGFSLFVLLQKEE